MAFTKVIANACSSQKQPILHRFWPDGLASRVLAIEMWIAPVRSSPISTRAPRNVSRIAVTFEKRASMLPLSILFTDCFEIPARFASSHLRSIHELWTSFLVYKQNIYIRI